MSKNKIKKNTVSKKKPNVVQKKVLSLKDKLQAVYNKVNLQTTCCGHCVCCNVACPQMGHSEFLVLMDKIWNEFQKQERIEILKKSIRYFFSTSLVKPCPLILGKRCSCYEVRPLNCRCFGLWPEDAYEERVTRFIAATGMKREDIPLNKQCQYVKRVDESQPLTKEIIDGLFNDVSDIDKAVGKYTDEQIAKKYNTRTFHDWMMVTVFGEQNLADLSKFFLAAPTQQVVDDFVEKMIDQVEIAGERVFKRLKNNG